MCLYKMTLVWSIISGYGTMSVLGQHTPHSIPTEYTIIVNYEYAYMVTPFSATSFFSHTRYPAVQQSVEVGS